MREGLDGCGLREVLLTPQSPWQSVDVYASLDSTNLEALRRPDPWRVVLADHQSAGRGRLARQWEAPARASVAVSCLVPLPRDRPDDWGWLPLLTGMAMCHALADVGLRSPRLKWPNDVLAREAGGSPDSPWRKVCGVLCEMVPTGDLVVAGTGANVDQSRDELPVDTATSIALCGVGDVGREDLVVSYLRSFAALHASWLAGGALLAALRAQYRGLCLTIGQDVDVHQPDGRHTTGRATAVDEAGRLVVETGNGTRAHAAGDVVHVRRTRQGAADGA